MKRRLATVALIFLTTAATVVFAPTPASANIAQGYVLGIGEYWDDWSDEGPLSASENNHSNVVAMWQHILWADGELGWSGIDCRFGPETSAATKEWKSRRSLPHDGIAGNKAFERALLSSLYYQDGHLFVYEGDEGDRYINFWRASDGIYSMSISGDVHNLGYNYANFDVCT